MANKPRDEADKDAGRPAEVTDTEKASKEAAKVEAKRSDIDAQFRDDVAKAAEKRDKALAKLGPRTGNIAEIAWNETKAEEDPEYKNVAGDFRQKLDTVVNAVRETGNADVVGLEAFEAKVAELLAEEKEEAGTPSKVAAKAKEVPDEATDTADTAKRGKLPEDFPHRAALEAAGYDTYAKVRKLGGDYTEVEGIGEARGKEIDEAL